MIRGAGAEGAQAGLIVVPSEAAKPCTPAALPASNAPSRGEYRAFGYAQTERLAVCEERRALGVKAMGEHNERVGALVKELKPKPWWKLW
jgi:hypothetical protein